MRPWLWVLLAATAVTRVAGAEPAHTRSSQGPTAAEVDDTPIFWWCAQSEHAESPVCKKLKFKQELREITDPAERVRIIAERKADSFTELTKEEVHAMREEERLMLAEFCKRPDRKHHPMCQGMPRRSDRKRYAEGAGAPMRDGSIERLHERPPLELDRVSQWWCVEGGHADALLHTDSMICASWRYRSAMRDAASEDAKKKLVDEYRAFKDAHKQSADTSMQSADIVSHLDEQQRMMAGFCDVEEHKLLKVCVKWLTRHAKTELRR
mmetsp:Transcript_5545/g.14177  ORF Transcript_5545/g.14177 Transcript_5545/m.14177 type:complete len:267 (+) Transcript_5545:44-844(+)|eukprot:CAMPEP_0119424606 /NCGR_PEP_ID=MMETSP1335-20130426/32923_1 /TAXON_ID=259385 /ORGANISM="Chrysoculter rhomboideus, Strain RCC1486" /LENGTH=266 /DNA_ID=CAMNT_0007450141 /DNA_START=23 /DNA_END=823 /DNA_ORIENTATION=+